MSVSLSPVETINVGVLALGGEGMRVMRELNLPSSWDVDCQVWDSCQNTLNSVADDVAFTRRVMGVSIAHGLGCVGQSELGRSIFLQDQESSKEWLDGKNLVIIVGSLGGGFASGFAPEFARMAKNMSIPCLAFSKLPFSFEGRKRIESSKQALSQLRELCLAVPIFEGDDYLNSIDDDGFAQPAVNASSLECAMAIRNLVHLVVRDGLYDFDLATINATFDLDVSKTLVVSSSSTSDKCVDETLTEIVEKFAQKHLNNDVQIDRLLISVVGGKTLPINDVNRINRTISDRFSNPGKTYFGACTDDKLEGVSVVVFISIHLGKQFELVDFTNGEVKRKVVHSKRKTSAGKKPSTRKKSKTDAATDESPQEFFDTILNESNRGYFDDTPSNSWNGIDLDVPTYIRRGIRVKT